MVYTLRRVNNVGFLVERLIFISICIVFGNTDPGPLGHTTMPLKQDLTLCCTINISSCIVFERKRSPIHVLTYFVACIFIALTCDSFIRTFEIKALSCFKSVVYLTYLFFYRCKPLFKQCFNNMYKNILF